MNSYRRNKTSSKLIAVTAIALAFFAIDLLFAGRLHLGLRAALTPVARWGLQAKNTIFGSEWWRSRASLLDENRKLREAISSMQRHDIQYELIVEENETLRNIAHVAGGRGITAHVETSLAASPYGTFGIDRGESDGVQTGAGVVAENGFVVGSITDTSTESATVRLMFAPGATIDAVVGKNVSASIEGRGAGNARARIPREAQVKVGDIVRAPGFAGRAIGVVGKLESASSSAYSDVYVQFPFNLNSLRLVYVLRP